MFVRSIIAIIVALSCVACSTAQSKRAQLQESDVQFTGSVGLVQWHKLTHEGVEKQCRPYYAKEGWQVAACYKMIDNVCHIYAEDGQTKMAALGHELKHCFDGLFHDDSGKWMQVTVDPVSGKRMMGASTNDGAANFLFEEPHTKDAK